MSAGLRAGYKQTEVGVIPEDWEVTALGNYIRITSGESPSLIRFTSRGKPYFKVEQLGNCEKYLSDESTPYHFLNGKTVPRNSVIFAKRGAAISLNRVRILSEDSFMDTNLMALTCLDGLDPEYLYYGLGHMGLWQFADTTSIPQINNKHVKPLCFLIPSHPEQRAIAAALSDVDALLDGLDRLIAKKRDLKQAAMQQLLTGQTRLPGFSGEWEVKRLGDMSPLQRGYDLLTSRLRPGPYPVVYSNGVSSYHSEFMVKGPGVVTGRSGTIGNVHFVEEDYWPHNTSLWVTSFKGNSPRFIFYLLSSLGLDRFSTGSGVPTLNRNDVHEHRVFVPPNKNEQTAIATILFDMDTELAALQTRRTKTLSLKQAMMQELLTGRIRLV